MVDRIDGLVDALARNCWPARKSATCGESSSSAVSWSMGMHLRICRF